jgi:hypothetical protein
MSGKQAKKKRHANRPYSSLEQHVRSGAALTPPWLTIPNLQKTSWMNDRLPELLWAVLLATQMERKAALEIFRSIARLGANHQGIGKIPITLSGIASMPRDVRDAVVGAITAEPTSRAILSSLTIFKDLPARETWLAKLDTPISAIDWMPLMNGVARTLHHQSQESTDCQWASLYFRVASGQLELPTDELNREIAEYPDVGDQRSVRPSIRASEITFDNSYKSEWSAKFWDQCLNETGCQFSSQKDSSSAECGATLETMDHLAECLVKHARSSIQTTAVDPKHDTIFGTAFYCLSILRELIGFCANESILARMGLRTVLECYVTLAYLAKKDDGALWQSYRVYGAGQGKLAFLKIDESSERPEYVSVDTLRALANEDQWQEFLPIDIGHWDKSNLRSMSEFAGVKADYDCYYSWPSAYVHGHWGAVSRTVFTTCLNPLHRLHRIPLIHARQLDGVIPDVIRLIDKILLLLDHSYPPFGARLATGAA